MKKPLFVKILNTHWQNAGKIYCYISKAGKTPAVYILFIQK